METINSYNGLYYIDVNIVEPLSINSPSKEVIKITKEGEIFWDGRKIETDDDFKAVVIEYLKIMSGRSL